MNTIYLFSIIILIFLIMVLKSIQYYYFLKDKQNVYVLIKKKIYAIWNNPNFIDYIKFTLYFYPKQNPTCIHLTSIN